MKLALEEEGGNLASLVLVGILEVLASILSNTHTGG